MNKIVKQVVGIDVAQKELVVSAGRFFSDLTVEIFSSRTFANSANGFESLESWTRKMMDSCVDTYFVMEATGVYHEKLAYYLVERGYPLSIVLPSKISNYIRTLEVKTVTDKTCSEAITRFGLERKLDNWQPPRKVYRSMRQLNREREQIVAERTMVKNHLHAEQAEAHPNEDSVTRIQKRIALLNDQEKQIRKEIAGLAKKDEQATASLKLLCSIPGIGMLTASAVLAETNGFELIRSKKQLASYAGFDVKEKQSGTSVRGKAKISKRGNKFLRKAMHLPALTAIKHDEHFKSIYKRLVARNGIKMKAAVAVQRRLLEMTYTIFKSQTPYDKNYWKQRQPLVANETTK